MKSDQEYEKTIIYKCTECGLSNSILKDSHHTTVDRQ
jgi:hypothetical protein